MQYVACAGVPEADPAHAVKMARFAHDCKVKMSEITKELGKLNREQASHISSEFRHGTDVCCAKQKLNSALILVN